MILLIHKLFAYLFFTFIIIDRFILRKFLAKERREHLYNRVKNYMIIISGILIITGSYLALYLGSSGIIVLKSFSAFLLIYMFFNCPKYMKKARCENCRKFYRSTVTLLLIIVFLLGIII